MINNTQQPNTNSCKFITFIAAMFKSISIISLVGGSVSILFGILYILYGAMLDSTIIDKLNDSSITLSYVAYSLVAILFGISNVNIKTNVHQESFDEQNK